LKKMLMFLLALPLALQSASPPTARAILDKMVAAQEKQAVFSCEVRREEWSESTPEAVRKVRGTLKIKAVGKARFEITSPVRQLLVCDGKTLWMVMPEAKQVMRQNAESLKTSGQFFLD
jgi:outer membrane lipoprotein-sorting protein